MVKVIYGVKGTGKTKTLIDTANTMSCECKGDIVFIDDCNELMFNLKHKIRFINVSDFPVKGNAAFLGFICGIISEDYDIEGIFIDGLTYITNQKVEFLESFFREINDISLKYNIKFYISINGEIENLPEFLKEYLLD
jgi:hypothetical protein